MIVNARGVIRVPGTMVFDQPSDERHVGQTALRVSSPDVSSGQCPFARPCKHRKKLVGQRGFSRGTSHSGTSYTLEIHMLRCKLQVMMEFRAGTRQNDNGTQRSLRSRMGNYSDDHRSPLMAAMRNRVAIRRPLGCQLDFARSLVAQLQRNITLAETWKMNEGRMPTSSRRREAQL